MEEVADLRDEPKASTQSQTTANSEVLADQGARVDKAPIDKAPVNKAPVITLENATRQSCDQETVAYDEYALPLPCLADMPDVVLAKIISFISVLDRKRIELVNRKWCRISRQTLKLTQKVEIDVNDYRFHYAGWFYLGKICR